MKSMFQYNNMSTMRFAVGAAAAAAAAAVAGQVQIDGDRVAAVGFGRR